MRDRFDVLLLAAAAAFIGVAAWAGVPRGDPAAEIEPRASPALAADGAALEMGELEWGEVRELAVPLVNRADGELIITGVDTPCGCTEAEVADARLAPGERTELAVKYAAGQSDGPVRRGLSIDYRIEPALGKGAPPAVGDVPPAGGRLNLTLSGDIVPQFRFVPAELSFDRDRPGEATLEAAPVRGAATIRDVQFGVPGFTAEPFGDGVWAIRYAPADLGTDRPAEAPTATVQVSRGNADDTEFFFVPVAFRESGDGPAGGGPTN